MDVSGESENCLTKKIERNHGIGGCMMRRMSWGTVFLKSYFMTLYQNPCTTVESSASPFYTRPYKLPPSIYDISCFDADLTRQTAPHNGGTKAMHPTPNASISDPAVT